MFTYESGSKHFKNRGHDTGSSETDDTRPDGGSKCVCHIIGPDTGGQDEGNYKTDYQHPQHFILERWHVKQG